MDSGIDRISRSLAKTSSRRRAFKLIGGGIIGGVVAAKGITSAVAAPPQATGLSAPVNFVSDAGSFVGSFNIDRFVASGGVTQAVGTLTGTVYDALGTVIGTVNQALTLDLLPTSSGSCQILHLELGPLDLDLLGLQVHLDKVVLDITAQSGPGNLLGNLLCGIAGLLDSGVTGGALARLLNQLLGLLG